jgi:hypothetical protein
MGPVMSSTKLHMESDGIRQFLLVLLDSLTYLAVVVVVVVA